MESSPAPDWRQRADGVKILLRALDNLEIGIALYDESGELLHRSSAMHHLIAESDARPILEAELTALVAEMIGRASPQALDCSSSTEHRAERVVRESSCTFCFRGSHVGEGRNGNRITILVTLERTGNAPSLEQRMREEYGLTSAQRKVARLLAGGRSNHKIAEELRISEHTAHNHTKAVLRKLGLTSRAQIAAVLQRLQEE